VEETPSGIPVPAESLAWLECAVRAEHPSGDHVLVTGEVVDVAVREKADPLTLRAAGLRYGW
jgi:flavin reductase (DIM6/NTAB) family NADH-FMN oxidoreductase RutF